MKRATVELAGCLGIQAETLSRWIRQGRIPARQEGDSCVFVPSVLERWARQRGLTLDFEEKRCDLPEKQDTTPSLLRAMEAGGVYYDLSGESVESALAAMVERSECIPESAKERLLERLLERERMTSTGIGKGVAIPHPRSTADNTAPHAMIVTHFLKTPVDFAAIDNHPVFILFLLICPDDKTHLHLLSRLAFCLRDDAFISFLRSAPAPEDLLRTVAEFETRQGA